MSQSENRHSVEPPRLPEEIEMFLDDALPPASPLRRYVTLAARVGRSIPGRLRRSFESQSLELRLVTKTPRNDSVHFRGLVSSAGYQMLAALRRSLLVPDNQTYKGDQREDGVRTFLRELLPEIFRVGTGFAFDSIGSKSRQLDVLISSRSPFTTSVAPDASALVPCEHLLAAAEVKSVLNREELRAAIANAESIRQLRPFGDQTFVAARARGVESQSGEHRVLYTVFALETDLAKGGDWLNREWARYSETCIELDVDPTVIDRIIVPDRGVLDTAHARGHENGDERDEVLGMWFVHLLNHLLREVSRRPSFDVNVYTPPTRWTNLAPPSVASNGRRTQQHRTKGERRPSGNATKAAGGRKRGNRTN